MHDYVAVVDQQPAITRVTLYLGFLAVFEAYIFQYSFGQGVQHTVAGARAEHEIVGKGSNTLDVEQ